MRRLFGRRGQSTLEYAVLIVVIIAALVAMQVYLKRGLQGRSRESADQIGQQFSPGYTVSNMTTNTLARTRDVSDAYSSTTELLNQWQDRTGNEVVANMTNEFWPS